MHMEFPLMFIGERMMIPNTALGIRERFQSIYLFSAARRLLGPKPSSCSSLSPAVAFERVHYVVNDSFIYSFILGHYVMSTF